jgi:hypothetical protein
MNLSSRPGFSSCAWMHGSRSDPSVFVGVRAFFGLGNSVGLVDSIGRVDKWIEAAYGIRKKNWISER